MKRCRAIVVVMLARRARRAQNAAMERIARDMTRDRRIEATSNLWLVHPLAHSLLPGALRLGLPANAVSLIGLALGAATAVAFAAWREPGMALLGLALGLAWLVADGLDGMVARATGTASPLGRLMDGLCDHGSFILIYAGLAVSLGTLDAWLLATVAGGAHALQSNLYETERARYHRRIAGDPGLVAPPRAGTPLERGYDLVAGLTEAGARRFDAALASAPDRLVLADRYAAFAARPMRAMTLLSANTRLFAIWLACTLADPKLFWWFEIVLLSVVALVTIMWHRHVERMTIR